MLSVMNIQLKQIFAKYIMKKNTQERWTFSFKCKIIFNILKWFNVEKYEYNTKLWYSVVLILAASRLYLYAYYYSIILWILNKKINYCNLQLEYYIIV